MVNRIGERKAAIITRLLARHCPSKSYPNGYQPYRVEPAFDGKREDVAFDFFCERMYKPGAVLIFEFKQDPFHPQSYDWQPVEEDDES